MLQERIQNYLQTLNDKEMGLLFGVINLNIYKLELDFDLDGVLAKTEIAAFDYCDKDLGTNYSGRKIPGFNPISKWLVEDGIMKLEEAQAYEKSIWDNPKVIMEAPVNKKLRNLSLAAFERHIPQSVTTSRPPELGQTTKSWLKFYFPWIPEENINIRTDKSVSGVDFKATKVKEKTEINPNLVHLEDALYHIRRILELTPSANVVGFLDSIDDGADIRGANCVFLPGLSFFESLIYYSDWNYR